ncbi:mitochondrial carrier [Pseudovirgaria hyperparasitica]|uniref:Mitochondrial carrier n=1 Tax=Pseudovirgaria hyperparasitica TaxID=470096 RepID=A0A6A6WEC6_9PEZI|nr:mitochondrial carrier [Pseudovirgaria hyperparasitica]KAF2759937.1 mitochondrial carrier [Pseudovirgaria hyperparasitica]
MSADFWAGYISGAIGILIGNPLDLIKTRLQAGQPTPVSPPSGPSGPVSGQVTWRTQFDRAGTLVRGASAPIIGYGALNALLFVSYNRTLSVLTSTPYPPVAAPSAEPAQLPALWKIYTAGCVAGFATFVVSAPTELIKCRAQVLSSPNTGGNSTGISTTTPPSSYAITRAILRTHGIRGLYHGGQITSLRDAIGYGFYFLSYEYTRSALSSPTTDTPRMEGLKVLLCGGFAGIVTWASIFPLDVIKTRVQTQVMMAGAATGPVDGGERGPLLARANRRRMSTLAVARHAYETEGVRVFFRGLGVCSVRAFVVNAVQWAMYEWVMKLMKQD